MTNRTCSMPACGKPHVARGYCRPHYENWRRTGNPVAVRTYTKGGRTCEAPGCERPHDSQGLCAGHKAQQASGRPMTALGEYRKATDRDEHGRKRCRTCDAWLATGEFHQNRRTADGLNPECLQCCRDRKVLSSYGLTAAGYRSLLDAQGGRCAICNGGEPGDLVVDHDHGCCPGRKSCGKCVRGLLCQRCNMGIGLFLEDPARLAAATAYIQRPDPR